MKNWKYIEGAKTGNAGITDKEFNSENEMRRWCIEHNYTYTPVGGGYYRLEDDSGKNRKDLEAHLKAGNKTGNADLSAISKNWSKTEIDHILQNAHVFKKEVVEEAKRLKEAEKQKTGNKNQDWDVGNIDWDVGIFNGQWYVTKNGQKLVGPFMSMKEAERYLDGHKWELQNKYGNSKIGNTQVGNADILSGNYIILADNGEVWFRDEHENVHIRNIDSWAQKRIASYQSSIDEIKKGVAEAKQAAKKAGMI